jgi:dihydropteroate synthase
VQNTAFSTNKTLNVNGRLIDISQPKIMGILNITPDSFYAGSRYRDETEILKRAERMLEEGAMFLDVGGYSSRPGAEDIPPSEELSRVLPAIRNIKTRFPDAIISIDTFRSEVAHAAVQEGASMVNDISAGELDGNMIEMVARFRIPYVAMHMKGNPQTMTKEATYGNLLKEILDHFHKKIDKLQSYGITDIIIDPGFGFAKTRQQNFELLKDLHLLSVLGKPMLVGLSRKSMVWKTLEIDPEDALNGTTVLNTLAILKGVSVLRVHDVKEAAEVIRLMQVLLGSVAETLM